MMTRTNLDCWFGARTSTYDSWFHPPAHTRHELGHVSSPQTRRMRRRSVRLSWLRSSRTWHCATWQRTRRTLRVSTDEGTFTNGATDSLANSPNSLRLEMVVGSPW